MYLETGRLLNNRYRVEEKIGAGGMAVVYHCTDIRLDREVTVKVLREEFTHDADFRTRFESEARAIARLAHPNIVTVYDVCEEDGISYIVMEYVEGDTLKAIIDENAPLSNKLVLTVALHIAEALSHAHKQGIIHRDIKPQNILVSVDGTVKVTDFGIARAAAGNTLSTTANALGSVHYFSPEQARGGYIDEKSDIYSLGISMFEMATGTVPFDGDTSVSVALKHLNEELPPIARYNANISHSVAGIIKKAARKKADERYSSVDQMIADLKRAMAEEKGEVYVPPVEEQKEVEVYVPRPRKPKEETPAEPERKREKPAKRRQPEPEPQWDDGEEDDRRAERRVTIAAIITAIIIILLILGIGGKMLKGKGFFEKEPVSVPSFVGLTMDEAKEKAKEFDLELQVGETVASEVEKGSIAGQSITEGELVQEGTIVTVTVSEGLKNYRMPGLSDTGESDAIRAIRDLMGITPDVVYEYSDTIPASVVLRQEPAEGTTVNAKSEIRLVISKGEEITTVEVPNLVGKSEAEARNAIMAAHLTVGSVTYMYSDTVEQGRVITQTVTAGSSAMTSSSVGLAVSKGKQAATENTEPAEGDEPLETVPTTPTTGEKTVNFSVTGPAMGDYGETVYVQLIQIKEDGSSTIVLDTEKGLGDFPFNVTLRGSGKESVQLYVDGNYQWSETVEFK